MCFWRQDKCDRKMITNYQTGTETKHIHCAYKDKTLSVLERGRRRARGRKEGGAETSQFKHDLYWSSLRSSRTTICGAGRCTDRSVQLCSPRIQKTISSQREIFGSCCRVFPMLLEVRDGRGSQPRPTTEHCHSYAHRKAYSKVFVKQTV